MVRILEISPSIEIISKNKYKRNELIGKSINDFCLNIGEDQTFLSAIQERGSVSDFEVTLKNQDGIANSLCSFGKITIQRSR